MDKLILNDLNAGFTHFIRSSTQRNIEPTFFKGKMWLFRSRGKKSEKNDIAIDTIKLTWDQRNACGRLLFEIYAENE